MIIPEKRIKNDLKYNKENSVGVFFSGGLDSYSTLIGHVMENPILMTIWGADIELDNEKGWNNVKCLVKEVSKQFNIDSILIKSNFRVFINDGLLSEYVSRFIDDSWWHAFQHGIGMISQAAPIAYKKNLKTIYVASSYSAQNKAITCASDPTIDNYIKYNNCQIKHDQYEYTRIEKIKSIINYAKNNNTMINLRVCWEARSGTNCCHCEKCYRTIYEIIACNANPNDYGFIFNDYNNHIAKKYMLYDSHIPNSIMPFWNEIKKELSTRKISPKYKWIYQIGNKNFYNRIKTKSINMIKKVKRRVQ